MDWKRDEDREGVRERKRKRDWGRDGERKDGESERERGRVERWRKRAFSSQDTGDS